MAHSQTKDRRVDVVSRAYPFTASPTDLSYHCSTLYITLTELKAEPGNILLHCFMNCMNELLLTYAEHFLMTVLFFASIRKVTFSNRQYVWKQIKFLENTLRKKVIYSSEEMVQSEQVFSIVGFLRLAQVSRWGYGYSRVNSSKIPRIFKTLQLRCLPDNLNTPFIVFSSSAITFQDKPSSLLHPVTVSHTGRPCTAPEWASESWSSLSIRPKTEGFD